MVESLAPVRTVAIIGAGRAGQEFAQLCLTAGLDVVLEDVMPATLRTARHTLQPIAAAGPGSLRTVLTVEDAVREADVAIDFVPDELESKLEIFSMVDRMAPPRTILCTPSDALSIADLASCTYRPQRCFALRSFTEALRDAQPVTLSYPENADAEARHALEHLLTRIGLRVRAEVDAVPPQLTRNV